jgi:MoaA/NifB/PqqE/SkfB family radical SAM enzyme
MRDKTKYKEIKFTEIQKMINNFGPSIKAVGLTGGEIFLREDIFDILDLLSEKKYSIGILSNATLLNEKMIKKLSKYNNVNIGTSIDGLEKNHNNIRGPKSFQKTLRTIKAINKKIPIGVTTVITKENINEITTLFKQIAPYINCYSVQFEIFNNKKEIKKSAKLLEIEKQKIVTWINKRTNYNYSEYTIAKVIKELRKLSKKYKVRFVTEPILAESYLNDFFNGNILTKQPLCNHVFSARADSRGNLVFCHLIKEKFGNLIETPLPKLWNSEPIRKVRKNLFKNMPPLCKRCCRIVEDSPVYDTPSTQL